MTQCSFDGISVFSLFSGWGSLDILTPPFWYRMYLRFLISVGLEETLDRKTIKESAAVFIRTSADGSKVRHLGEKRSVSPGLGEALDGSPGCSDSGTRGRDGGNPRAPKAARECSIKHIVLIILHAMRPQQRQIFFLEIPALMMGCLILNIPPNAFHLRLTHGEHRIS